MYNSGGAIGGGGVMLAVTGGNGSLLPLILASVAIAVGGLLVLRQRWLASHAE